MTDFNAEKLPPRSHRAYARYAPHVLNYWRSVGDPLADAVCAVIARKQPSNMLAEVEQRARSEGGIFQSFLEQCHTVPDWVNFEQMEAWRHFGHRHSVVAGTVLLAGSLVEGYTLRNANKVLVGTGRLEKDVTRRLYETTQMVWSIGQPGGIRPGTEGHRILMEVRLLHAAVRHFLLKRGGWNHREHGFPANQEDMAFTIIEFDHLVARGMQRLGVTMSQEVRESQHHFWRYAAWILGVDEFFLTHNPEETAVLYAQICAHQQKPDEDSVALAHAVLNAMAGQPPFYAPVNMLMAQSRLLVGDALADGLKLPDSLGWKPVLGINRLLVRGFSRALPRIPGGEKMAEQAGLALGRYTLEKGLGKKPADFAFKKA